jgi:hypothetical protein
MNTSYGIWGIACLLLGIYLTMSELKTIRSGKQNEFGWDIKGLAGGICFIIIGIYLVVKCFKV